MVRTLVVQLAGEEFSPQDDATASLTLDASLFSARRVRHFLDSLASRNLLLRAQWTLRALVAQNRGDLDPSRRLSTMRVYRPRVERLIEELREHYSGTPLPFTASAGLKHRLAADLLIETATGYRRIVDDVLAGGGGGRSTLAAAVCGAMRFYAEVLVDAWEVFQPAPTGVWNHLHGLYALAEERGLLGEAAHGGGGAEAVATPMDDYRRVLLLGVCDPYALRPGECRRVYRWLTDWQRAARVGKRVSFETPGGRFLVSLRGDSPPVPLGRVSEIRSPESVRSLDAIEVARRVHARLQGMSAGADGDTGCVKHRDPAARDPDVALLHRIGRAWGGVDSPRRWHRLRSSSVVELAVGMAAICRLVPGSQADGGKGAAVSASNGHAAGDPVSVPPVYVLAGVNESAGGLCLFAPASVGIRLNVGEPVAWRARGDGRWSAGAVRWLRSDDTGEVEFGVECFAVEVRCVEVSPASIDGIAARNPVPGLWLPEGPAQGVPGDGLLWSGAGDVACRRLWIADRVAARGGWWDFQVLERGLGFERLQLVPIPVGSPEAN
jgi:hypothetical protein